jgi:uncharacterized membrane protein
MSTPKGATEVVKASRHHAFAWLRTSFFTGIVVGAPIGITIWLIWSFISFVDHRIKPLIPTPWNPETYLKFALPGLGIVVAVVALTLLGALTTNFLGRTLLRLGEQIVNRVPLISPIYFALKQVFETFAKSEGSSFKEAVLVPFPHANSWSVGFVTNRNPGGAIALRIIDPVAVLIPHVPNPASGLLVYVPAADIIPLEMPIDQALKLVISFGILTPDQLAVGNAQAKTPDEEAKP